MTNTKWCGFLIIMQMTQNAQILFSTTIYKTSHASNKIVPPKCWEYEASQLMVTKQLHLMWLLTT